MRKESGQLTQRMVESAADNAAFLVLGFFSAALLFFYRIYFTTAAYPSVDLTSHIALTERLLHHMLNGQLFFYDTAEFTGWPAFQFYGFGAHLVTAVFGMLLSPFLDEPVRAAAQFLALAGVAALPFSLHFAAFPFFEDMMGASPARRDPSRMLLAFVVGTLTVWFLSLGESWFGIGAGAIFQFGLYSQGFGWHLMLVHLGLLARAVRGRTRGPLVGLTVVFALLLVTHPLSAAFCGGVTALAVLYFSGQRIRLSVAHALAVGMAGFWIVPFFAFSDRFTLSGVTPVSYDLWQLLIRYPLTFLARWLPEALGGRVLPINPTHVVLGGLLVLALAHRRVRATSLVAPFLVLLLLIAALVPSTYLVTSIPLGLHYQRFLGLLALVVLAPLAAVPFALLPRREENHLRAPVLIGAVFAVCLVATAGTPDRRQAVVEAALASPGFLAAENEVLRYFREQTPPGRVLFEWYDEPGRYPPLCERYIQSQLVRQTGFESANGLLVQSAPTYRYTVLTSMMLGARTTAGYRQPNGGLFQPGMSDFPLLAEWRMSRLREPNLARLRLLGVTHVVAGTRSFLDSLMPAAIGEVVTIGPYSIVRIGNWAPATPVVQGEVIGYVDLKNNLPFSFVDLFVQSSPDSANHELLLLEPGKPIPSEVSQVIVNGDPQRHGPDVFFDGRSLDELLAGRRRIALDYEEERPTGSLISPVKLRAGEEGFRSAERYLAERLGQMPSAVPSPGAVVRPPTLTWEPQKQSFLLTDISPGRLVRIGYSFLPYWRSGDGNFYRGTAERMFFLPRTPTARASYSRWSMRSTWLGWAATLLSGAAFLVWWRARPG